MRVKKGHCGNGSLSLAWDGINVNQVALYITTGIVQTFYQELWKERKHIPPCTC